MDFGLVLRRPIESTRLTRQVDLLFLGHRDTTITIALLAAFFSVTKNTARPKPGGTEPTRNMGQTLSLSATYGHLE